MRSIIGSIHVGLPSFIRSLHTYVYNYNVILTYYAHFHNRYAYICIFVYRPEQWRTQAAYPAMAPIRFSNRVWRSLVQSKMLVKE